MKARELANAVLGREDGRYRVDWNLGDCHHERGGVLEVVRLDASGDRFIELVLGDQYGEVVTINVSPDDADRLVGDITEAAEWAKTPSPQAEVEK